MAAITDYMFDTSFVQEVIDYLHTEYSISTRVLDSGEHAVIPKESQAEPLPVTKFFPFDFQENIGGLECSANDETALAQAESHILFCLKGINNLLLRELELQQTSDEMLQLSSQLNFLFKLSSKLIGINKMQDFSDIILNEISQVVQAEKAFLNADFGPDEKFKIRCNLSSQKLKKVEQDVNFQVVDKDRTSISTLDSGESMLIAPINSMEGTNGFMVFLKDSTTRFFTAYEKKFVSIIEEIISPTIEAIQLNDSLQDLYLNTVKALAAAIDAKDEYTHGHSFRVAKYSVAIGMKINIPEHRLTELEIAAYMHDLGKIGISESILSKPEQLTDTEYGMIKKHPEMTGKILEPINLPDFIVNAAEQHHERVDGSGYPHGLKGHEISLFARVIMVADAFDAMTSARPYREAMSVETALEEICNGVDKEFDRCIVLGLIETLQDKETHLALREISPDLQFFKIQHFNEYLYDISQLLIKAVSHGENQIAQVTESIADELKKMESENLFALKQKVLKQ